MVGRHTLKRLKNMQSILRSLRLTLCKINNLSFVPVYTRWLAYNWATSDDTCRTLSRWSGGLPRAGTYLIAVGSTRGDARYSIDVKVE
jgi:hypothetical protein